MSSEGLTPLEQDAGWFETQHSRGRFLRKLGLMAAAGTAAVFLPGTAHGYAQNTVCCPDTAGRCGNPCSQTRYYCQDSCNGHHCCMCQQNTGCFVQPCEICP
jgi:hypothetical protein